MNEKQLKKQQKKKQESSSAYRATRGTNLSPEDREARKAQRREHTRSSRREGRLEAQLGLDKWENYVD